jgi:hypothetical protein
MRASLNPLYSLFIRRVLAVFLLAGTLLADEITMSAPRGRVDLEALKATKATRPRGADMVISSAPDLL